MTGGRPLVLIDPWPRDRSMILGDGAMAELEAMAEVVAFLEGSRMPDALLMRHLPKAAIIVGQPELSAERIASAPHLQAVINVKGNWEPTLDYAACRARGIHVLSAAPAMAPAVAEWCLGAAIDLGRGITPAHEAFRKGEERYGIQGNEAARTLFGATVGLVGYGNLGRALRPLLAPFGCRVLVHDPWLPAGYLEEQGCEAAELDTLLGRSAVIFLLAGVTTENEGFLDRPRLERIAADASVVLASRAEIVDFEAFLELAEAGRFRAAIDVFPEEPVDAEDPIRWSERLLLSAHRAGGTRHSYARISAMLMDDIRLILGGLPPVRLQRAEPGTAALMRSR